MNVEHINDKKLWDSFVDVSPNASLFHKWDFLNLVKTHSGYELLRLGVFNGDELECICPLFHNKSRSVKTIFSAPPKSSIPYSGPALGPNYSQLNEHKKEIYTYRTINELCKKIQEFSSNYAYIQLAPDFLDTRAYIWQGYDINLLHTYVINLNRPLEDIWSGFNRKCRRQINSMPLSVNLNQSKNVDLFYNSLCNRYAEQNLNLPLFSCDYIKDIVNKFPENIKLYYLYDEENNLLGSRINYMYKSIYMFWMGALKPPKNVHSNEYLTWEFIKKAKLEGREEFELYGAGVKRLCQYKSKYHPSLRVSYSATKKDFLGKFAERLYKSFVKKKVL